MQKRTCTWCGEGTSNTGVVIEVRARVFGALFLSSGVSSHTGKRREGGTSDTGAATGIWTRISGISSGVWPHIG